MPVFLFGGVLPALVRLGDCRLFSRLDDFKVDKLFLFTYLNVYVSVNFNTSMLPIDVRFIVSGKQDNRNSGNN